MRNFAYLVGFLMLSYPAVALAEEVRIETSRENCARIQKHVARDDVTYKPGVDVHGKPVAPADLQDQPKFLKDEIIIDLSLPLKDLYDLASPPSRALQNAEVQVGQVRYDMLSGKFYFNDQPLADTALHAIAEKCVQIYGLE